MHCFCCGVTMLRDDLAVLVEPGNEFAVGEWDHKLAFDFLAAEQVR